MPTELKRLVFVDVLRLIAAVQMIQGHAVSAVLAPVYEQGPLFRGWLFARGLTSVMFLFAAGYSFALGGGSKLRRALTLIALGYLMHAPFALLLGAPREATLQAALAVDVLQCIGVSLLALEALRGRARLALVLGCLSMMGAPWLANVEGPRLLTNYLTTRDGSLFPLLPWSGYVLIGFALGSVRAKARELALAGAVSCLLGIVAYAFLKLGCVLLLAAGLAWACRRPLPPVLARLSRETLFLYLSHVVILYADRVGLEARWRDQHSPWFGAGLAVALMAVCGAGALAWRRLREGGTKAPQS